ncbi:MAG: FAD-linked oxidase C-terminal domain-containing protein [bacterium]
MKIQEANKNKIIIDKLIIKEFEAILGKDYVLTSYEERYCYSYDASPISTKEKYLPDIVLLPENAMQISKILQIANKNNLPITTRAAGTNHVGGCLPIYGGIVIHTSRLNKIITVDTENLICTAQAGVPLYKIHQEVEKQGLFYPPDPCNLRVSTLGGSIAMSSGGPRGFKYGCTKDYILELEVVLADGNIIKTGAKTVKNVTGYNLTQLFIGSEGTLGIVTEATLKLIPKPETRKVFMAFFNSIDEASNTVTSIISDKIVPSTLDLLDKSTLQTIEKFNPTGLPTDMEAALLVEIDGSQAIIEEQANKITTICNKYNAKYIKISTNNEEAEEIWTARRAAFGAVSRLRPNVITEDTVVPRNKIPEMIREIKKLAEKYNILTCIMGHAGDGNIHPNFSLDLRNQDEVERFELLVDELIEITIKLGGTLSGEHGIGLTKLKYMPKAVDPIQTAIMKQIKTIFDPKDILNSGKMI